MRLRNTAIMYETIAAISRILTKKSENCSLILSQSESDSASSSKFFPEFA